MLAGLLRALSLPELWRDERGQDLIEYALLAGFITVAGGAVFPPIFNSVSSIFSKVVSVLDKFS